MRQARVRPRRPIEYHFTYSDIVAKHREIPETYGDDPVSAFTSISDLLEQATEHLDVDKRQREARAMPYEEYLKTEYWRMTRRAALRHYGKQCGRCGSAEDINIHHRTYERLGAEELADLEVLCRSCHAQEHGIS